MTAMCINLFVQPLIWIKNRVFSQRLRNSIHHYFEHPWFLWTAQAERLVDLRDEEMVLREDDALGELPEELQYEFPF